jgi:hypothetical protein
MTVTRAARGNRRTRRGQREMRERFLPIDRPFDRQPPELNNGGGHEETEIGVDAEYARRDAVISISGNESSARVENISVHDAVSAHVNSSELHLTAIPSRPESERHDSIECMPLDDRLPHSMDTAANALLENEVFYREDIPALMDRNDSSSPPASPDIRDTKPVGEGSTIVEPLAEEDGIIATSERALDWQSLFAVLLCSGTVRMTVEYYETLRETLIWQALKHGKREDALPGIRKIQRVLMPLMRRSFYARSEVIALRKRHGGTEQVRVVVPSEWAILDTCTAPIFDALFSRHSSASTEPGPSFLFDDIENTPIVRQRNSILDASRYIFVDTNQREDAAPFPRLPVPAGPGDFIEVKFTSSIEADSILGTETIAEMQTGTSVRCAIFKIVSIWDMNREAPSLSGTTRSFNLFARCRTMKPGDTVVELDPSVGDTIKEYSFVLLYRFRRSVPAEALRQLYFIPRRALSDGELEPALCTVSQVRGVQLTSSCTPFQLSRSSSRCTGYLNDGRRYVIYRVALYSDEFQPNSSTTSSYGGCYMLPMGLPPAQRSGSGAVRCIGLTPPQVSTNEVLQYIVPDLAKCCTTGVQGLDPNGNPVTIFIDVLGFIGDYPAISHALDVLGHNSRAPCHLCCFVRQDRIGHGHLPYYGHTAEIHSKSTAFIRSVQRMHNVRSEDSNIHDLAVLGFKKTFNVDDYPLHALSSALSAARDQVPFTDHNEPVVPAIFDPYRSSLVAPDHLLFGLAQDVLRGTIALCTPQARNIADVLMRSTLNCNCLTKQRQIINPTSASINAMGMSDLFAVLLIAPICFENALHLDGLTRERSAHSTEISIEMERNSGKRRKMSRAQHVLPPRASKASRPSSPGSNASAKPSKTADILELLTIFQRLVRDTHFWPCSSLDGASCVEDCNRNDGETQLDILYGIAVKYISALHKFCVRDNGVVAKYLNKPNVHRLLELYTHTIPAFGHCRHVQELLFETAHQPLKRAITRSNQRDPHIHAVTATLANDWECRLSIEVNRCGEPDSWSIEDCRRIKRLITGRDMSGATDVQEVRSAFCKPVLSQLKKVRRKLSSNATHGVVWKMHYDYARVLHPIESWRKLSSANANAFDEAVECVKASTALRSFQPRSLRVARYASSWYTHDEQTNGRRRSGNIFQGSVVQALVNRTDGVEKGGGQIQELETPRSHMDFHSVAFRVSFWFVLGLFEAIPNPLFEGGGASDERVSLPYAVVLPCATGISVPVTDPVRVNPASSAYILPLGRSIRETMCIHACAYTANCMFDDDNVQHSGLLGDGTPFYVLGRREGYPPRVA